MMETLKYIVFIVIGVVLLLLIFFESEAHEGVHFKTDFIRDAWAACFKTANIQMPFIPPPVKVMLCDCVIDKGRNFFQSEENMRNYTDNTTKLWEGFASDCSYEIQMKNKPANAVSF